MKVSSDTVDRFEPLPPCQASPSVAECIGRASFRRVFDEQPVQRIVLPRPRFVVSTRCARIVECQYLCHCRPVVDQTSLGVAARNRGTNIPPPISSHQMETGMPMRTAERAISVMLVTRRTPGSEGNSTTPPTKATQLPTPR